MQVNYKIPKSHIHEWQEKKIINTRTCWSLQVNYKKALKRSKAFKKHMQPIKKYINHPGGGTFTCKLERCVHIIITLPNVLHNTWLNITIPGWWSTVSNDPAIMNKTPMYNVLQWTFSFQQRQRANRVQNKMHFHLTLHVAGPLGEQLGLGDRQLAPEPTLSVNLCRIL